MVPNVFRVLVQYEKLNLRVTCTQMIGTTECVFRQFFFFFFFFTFSAWQFEIAPGAAFEPDEVYELEIECDDGDKKTKKQKFYVHIGLGQDIFWNYGGKNKLT